MGTLTSRLKLFKPAGTDVVDVAADLNAPYDILDAEVGAPNVAISSPLPSVPYSGQIRCDRNDGFVKQWNAGSSIWEPLFPIPGYLLQGAGGAWKQINPTLLNITLGTPSQTNILDYIRLPGNLIFWKWKLILGTGGAVTGTAGFTLPAEFPCDAVGPGNPAIVEDPIGHGRVGLISGTSLRHSVEACIINTGPPGNVFLVINDTGNPVNGTGSNPFAWAAGGAMLLQGIYRTSAV